MLGQPRCFIRILSGDSGENRCDEMSIHLKINTFFSFQVLFSPQSSKSDMLNHTNEAVNAKTRAHVRSTGSLHVCICVCSVLSL